MDRSTTTTMPETRTRLAILGGATTTSGLLGVVVGVVTLAYPAAVSPDLWSYPFPTGVAWVSSIVLALTHALTAVGFVGVVLASPHRDSRPATIGLWAAIVGFVGLAACELASGAVGGQSATSSTAQNVGTAFGIASLLTALGSVVAGIAIVRAHLWTGLGRWIVLVSGVLMIAVVTPAIIVGDLWPRILALILWSITFVPMGRAISTSEPR